MEMDLLGSFRIIRTGGVILFCLISIDVFATPPVPEWIRSRWVKTFQRETVHEVKDQSLIFHDPKCAPFLCLKQKERRKITWNPEVMRESNQGIQAITRRNYKLREEVRVRWVRKGSD
ncbi:MAG: hypothetical protein QF537_03400 [SAR324 cluster bacterium]|jgi:hypothetical protein|nr:hypothetical protein [Deltaproteobacteria bacterium]MAE00480.1 hypothetical protein [Pseudomonadota bacterium]MDP6090975.1 hypothetical protein [SAR324 cluster bacterium]MBI12809.1 hypothetical protein [Deltaproteobacteria bacterium]MBP44886.1 hypothetical protein [Deltaproteobacteria bacterium]